jgi:hypothetical protein
MTRQKNLALHNVVAGRRDGGEHVRGSAAPRRLRERYDSKYEDGEPRNFKGGDSGRGWTVFH